MKYRIKLSGMGCSHCVQRLTNAMKAIGASIISIQLNDCVVDFGDDDQPLKEAAEELGFDVLSIEKV